MLLSSKKRAPPSPLSSHPTKRNNTPALLLPEPTKFELPPLVYTTPQLGVPDLLSLFKVPDGENSVIDLTPDAWNGVFSAQKLFRTASKEILKVSPFNVGEVWEKRSKEVTNIILAALASNHILFTDTDEEAIAHPSDAIVTTDVFGPGEPPILKRHALNFARVVNKREGNLVWGFDSAYGIGKNARGCRGSDEKISQKVWANT